MSLPSTMYRVIDCALRASTTFEAVSSITEATSSLLGAGLEMILISRERLRELVIAGAAIRCVIDGIATACAASQQETNPPPPGPARRGELASEGAPIGWVMEGIPPACAASQQEATPPPPEPARRAGAISLA